MRVKQATDEDYDAAVQISVQIQKLFMDQYPVADLNPRPECFIMACMDVAGAMIAYGPRSEREAQIEQAVDFLKRLVRTLGEKVDAENARKVN